MFPRSEFYCRSIFAGLVAWLSPRMERYCRIVKRVDFGQNIAGTARCHHGMADGMIGLILSDAPGQFFRRGIGTWYRRGVVLAVNGAMSMSWWLFSSIFVSYPHTISSSILYSLHRFWSAVVPGFRLYLRDGENNCSHPELRKNSGLQMIPYSDEQFSSKIMGEGLIQ